MVSADLLFSRPPATSANLVFGETGAGPSVPDVTIAGAGRITGMRVQVQAHTGAIVLGAGRITGMRCRVVATYDVNVSRPTVGQTTHHYQQAQPAHTGLHDAYQQAQALPTGLHSRYQQAQPLQAPTSAAWDDAAHLHTTIGLRYQQAQPVHHLGLRSAWQTAQGHRVGSALRYQEAWPLQVLGSLRFQRALSLRHDGLHRYQEALRSGRIASARFQRALPIQTQHRVRYQEAWPPRPGLSVLIPVEPPGPPPCYVPNGYLVFSEAWDGGARLVFVCRRTPDGPEPIVIPARKVYFIVNNLHLTRVSDDVEIEILSASVGIDKSSWAWSFTGSIAYTEFEKIEPTSSGPVEVELTINAIKWRFLVEEYDRNETFGKTAINIKGRSVTAYLGAPYAPVRSIIQGSATTSRQMAEDELTRAGLVTGFELDWMFPDELGWPMPAGTWSYNQLSPIDVINQLVQGAGGFVNSHPELKKLIVRPEYSAGFWDWPTETPDLYLPRALIRSQNLKWTEKPLYNGVYVSGENTGVQALVKKMGTLGDFQAPPYVSPMISHDIAARMKGLAILSAGGKQASVGLEMPMESSAGLIVPGMLIEVVSAGVGPSVPEWRGVITSTNINAAWGEALTVSQSVEVERHYGGF
jgi:hypothetical protein